MPHLSVVGAGLLAAATVVHLGFMGPTFSDDTKHLAWMIRDDDCNDDLKTEFFVRALCIDDDVDGRTCAPYTDLLEDDDFNGETIKDARRAFGAAAALVGLNVFLSMLVLTLLVLTLVADKSTEIIGREQQSFKWMLFSFVVLMGLISAVIVAAATGNDAVQEEYDLFEDDAFEDYYLGCEDEPDEIILGYGAIVHVIFVASFAVQALLILCPCGILGEEKTATESVLDDETKIDSRPAAKPTRAAASAPVGNLGGWLPLFFVFLVAEIAVLALTFTEDTEPLSWVVRRDDDCEVIEDVEIEFFSYRYCVEWDGFDRECEDYQLANEDGNDTLDVAGRVFRTALTLACFEMFLAFLSLFLILLSCFANKTTEIIGSSTQAFRTILYAINAIIVATCVVNVVMVMTNDAVVDELKLFNSSLVDCDDEPDEVLPSYGVIMQVVLVPWVLAQILVICVTGVEN
uniref:Uncharacterized protein n=1 Tax=Pinguiococcus pyrenoidosus TaxID=172671 RepID=A0A7R9Y9T6_9STRA|mmetsp:Transcript_14686/g.55584  ORF Transcript_14686/g.55584 Transcript_14686/m.55584 type:complete len:460 (+) Transcript_14686:484-1863(+)